MLQAVPGWMRMMLGQAKKFVFAMNKVLKKIKI
jgi:hypothetical protein